MLRNREKFACEAAFFFLFRRAVFRKSCLLETFHIWIGKNCDLVATINSLPHFDWKHAVLALTPEYQVYTALDADRNSKPKIVKYCI